ncbi:MAG TPA: hypothetical protein VKA19_14415 [Alphaproteobacteria bacterium]|nr:hypothetical protein [Alphaproteobacteria bacterium]
MLSGAINSEPINALAINGSTWHVYAQLARAAALTATHVPWRTGTVDISLARGPAANEVYDAVADAAITRTRSASSSSYANDLAGNDIARSRSTVVTGRYYPSQASYPASFADSPSVLTEVIPSYLYVQYNDDDDLQAFVAAYNEAAQTFLSWFVSTNLGDYRNLSGSLLDWIARGIYGMSRPVLGAPAVPTQGVLNSDPIDDLAVNQGIDPISGTYIQTTDDIFQRVLTWHLYRGDGHAFTVTWLKRRIMRFLTGARGYDADLSDLSPVSVSISGSAITITLSASYGWAAGITDAFTYAVQSGAIDLPPVYTYTITVA